MDAERLLYVYIVEIQIGFFVTLFVTLIYGFMAPWYKSSSGWYIFGLLAALTLMLGNTVVRIYFKEWAYSLAVGISFFAFFILAMSALGVGIVRAQLKGRIKNNHDLNR